MQNEELINLRKSSALLHSIVTRQVSSRVICLTKAA